MRIIKSGLSLVYRAKSLDYSDISLRFIIVPNPNYHSHNSRAMSENSLPVAVQRERREIPEVLKISVGLLFFNAVALLIWWVIFPEDVTSNGAQVFFVLLWAAAGWGLLTGEGWVRVALIIVVVAYAWGLVNQPSLSEGIAKINFADHLSKFIALAAIVLAYVPASHTWFKSIRQVKTAELNDEA